MNKTCDLHTHSFFSDGSFTPAEIIEKATKLGYTESINHAFKTLLSKSHGHYTEPQRITVFEMLDFLKTIGAIPVLAHPFLDLSEEELMEFLPLAKENGLIGMECYYSLYDKNTIKKSLEIAAHFGLKPSGGSDFHRVHKPDIKLGGWKR